MFRHTLPHPPLDSRPNFKNFSVNGRYGLPNSVREALLQAKKGEAALLVDALLCCGYTAGKLLTVRRVADKLVEKGFKLSKGLIRRALNSGVFKWGTLQIHRAGRPEKVYHMPEVSALVKDYANGSMSASDPLENKDIQGLKVYRQGLHREFIRRAPGIYSRKFLGQRLGVGDRTTRNYDLCVGIRSIRQLTKENLLWFPDWREKIESGKAGRNWLRIYYKNGRFFDAPLFTGIARKFLWREGVEGVYLVGQSCNRYVYAPNADWADHQHLYLHDDERAFAASSDPLGYRKERLNFVPRSATLSVDAKAYQPTSNPIPAWLPPEMAAKRISINPFLPRHRPVSD